MKSIIFIILLVGSLLGNNYIIVYEDKVMIAPQMTMYNDFVKMEKTDKIVRNIFKSALVLGAARALYKCIELHYDIKNDRVKDPAKLFKK